MTTYAIRDRDTGAFLSAARVNGRPFFMDYRRSGTHRTRTYRTLAAAQVGWENLVAEFHPTVRPAARREHIIVTV